MLVLCVDVHVKPEQREAFIQACRANHLGSRQEPGNRRWDFLQDEEDPNRFMLYEAYQDQAALEAHQKQPHFLQWRQAVEPMMAAPRTRRRLSALLPESSSAW
jgi:autoinducer 2-degrading protein